MIMSNYDLLLAVHVQILNMTGLRYNTNLIYIKVLAGISLIDMTLDCLH
jgi:hypothetical protein